MTLANSGWFASPDAFQPEPVAGGVAFEPPTDHAFTPSAYNAFGVEEPTLAQQSGWDAQPTHYPGDVLYGAHDDLYGINGDMDHTMFDF